MINDFESFGHFVKSRNNETGEESFWYGQTLEDFDLTDEEAEKLTFLSLILHMFLAKSVRHIIRIKWPPISMKAYLMQWKIPEWNSSQAARN